jgi:hypothetical protein
MAITSSGELSMSTIISEFSNTPPVSLSEYRGVDPWLPVPYAGEISFSDFYGADNNTARVNSHVGKLGSVSTAASGRFGFSKYKGSGHAYEGGETGNHSASFGSISRNIYFSTGKRVEAFYSAIYGRPKAWIYLTTRNSVNTGFTKLSVRFNNRIQAYGNPLAADSTDSLDVDYETELVRTEADFFGLVPNSYYNGSASYYWAWDCTAYNDFNGVQYALERASESQSTGTVSVKLFT